MSIFSCPLQTLVPSSTQWHLTTHSISWFGCSFHSALRSHNTCAAAQWSHVANTQKYVSFWMLEDSPSFVGSGDEFPPFLRVGLTSFLSSTDINPPWISPGVAVGWQPACLPTAATLEGPTPLLNTQGGWTLSFRLISLPTASCRSNQRPSPGFWFKLSSQGNVAHQERVKAKGDCQTQMFHSCEDGF